MAFQNFSNGAYANFSAGSIPANRDILFFNNSEGSVLVNFTTTTSPEENNWDRTLEPNTGFVFRAPEALSTCVAATTALHTGIRNAIAGVSVDDDGAVIGATGDARIIAAQLGGSFGG